MLRAFSILKTKDNVAALTFGNGNLEDIDIEVISTGFVRDPHKQSLIYSAADLFVMPSLEDNLPQTGIEAMACGTPVVGSKNTGLSESIDHRINGYLFNQNDITDLKNGIEWVINNNNYQNLCQKAIQKTNTNFSNSVVSKKYIELYSSIIKEKIV